MATVERTATSTWERISAWYAENKVVAWTVAGVTVVAAGGTVYYLNTRPQAAEGDKKPRRKKGKKKDVEKAAVDEIAPKTGKPCLHSGYCFALSFSNSTQSCDHRRA